MQDSPCKRALSILLACSSTNLSVPAENLCAQHILPWLLISITLWCLFFVGTTT